MFDVGFQELTLIGVIALIVVGPERLPRMARTLGLWMGKVRYYVGQVKRDIEREVRAQELKEMLDKPAGELDDLYKVAEETKGTLDQARDALGEAESAFDERPAGISTPGEPAAGSIFPSELPEAGPARDASAPAQPPEAPATPSPPSPEPAPATAEPEEAASPQPSEAPAAPSPEPAPATAEPEEATSPQPSEAPTAPSPPSPEPALATAEPEEAASPQPSEAPAAPSPPSPEPAPAAEPEEATSPQPSEAPAAPSPPSPEPALATAEPEEAASPQPDAAESGRPNALRVVKDTRESHERSSERA